MIAQDSPAFPCVNFLRLRFRGKVNRLAMQLAVERMVDRHPLFRALLIKHDGRARWNILPNATANVVWLQSLPDDAWLANCAIDLTQETGLVVFACDYQADDRTDRCDLIIKIHHACADGLGTLAAVHELLLIFHALCKHVEPELPLLDSARLPHRNQFGLNAWQMIRLIPRQLIGLHGVRQFLMRRPVPVVPQADTLSADAQPLSVSAESHLFSRSETRSFQQTAHRLKVTLNELLAACIFESLAQFRSEQKLHSDDDWLRMMIPVSMRAGSADQHQTACNIVSSVFLDRRYAQIRDSSALLTGIHDEMELIKKNRLALMFNFSVWLRSLWSRGRPTSQPQKSCQTSVVFTNLGKVFLRSPLSNSARRLESGELELETIEPVAPLAPFMLVAFSASIYAEQLRLLVRFDERVLDRADAMWILQEACARLTLRAASMANGVHVPVRRRARAWA